MLAWHTLSDATALPAAHIFRTRQVCPKRTAGCRADEPHLGAWAAAARAAAAAVQHYGGAKAGARTMLDALLPAVGALEHATGGSSGNTCFAGQLTLYVRSSARLCACRGHNECIAKAVLCDSMTSP